MSVTRTRTMLAIVIGGIAVSARAQSPRLETSDVYRRVAKQVVEIRVIEISSNSKSQIGSGFFASATGDIVTNFHVIAPLINEPASYRAEWIEESGAAHPLRVLAVDVVHDLAVVGGDRPTGQFFQLMASPITQGTRLYALGHPHDLGLSIVEGTYNGFLPYTLYPRIHFTGAINPGMSGGPAIMADGRVVGVNVATAGNSIGFLVPVDRAAALLARVQAPGYTPPTDFMPEIAEQVRAYQSVFFSTLLSDSTPNVTMGAHTLPTLPQTSFKCWGDLTRGENERRYDFVSHTCSTDDAIFLSDDKTTGYAYLKYLQYTTHELSALQFYSLLATRFKTMASEMEGGEREVTNFQCRTRNVRRQSGEHAAVLVRIATCLRAYKKLPGVYDMISHVAVLGSKDTAILAELTLAGVSYENGERITKRFLERIQ